MLNQSARKIIMSFLLLSIFLLSASVGATENSPPTVILGTDANITGYIVPDDQNANSRAGFYPSLPGDTVPGIYQSIFSIKAEQVTELLVSNRGAKSFTIGSLPSGANYIVCKATLYHSLSDEVNIVGEFATAGICYYGYNLMYDDNVYNSVACIGFREEQLGTELTDKFSINDILERNETYYSYVKNIYPAGYVYGHVSLYASDT